MVLKAKIFSSYQTSSRLLGSALISYPAEGTHTASSATIMAQSLRLEVLGTNLVYDNTGSLIGGQVLRLEVYDPATNTKAMEITGFSMDIGALPADATVASLQENPVWELDGSVMTQAGPEGSGVIFRAEAGNDTLTGSQFGDEFHGEDGRDSLVGGLGRDSLDGGTGRDELEGGDNRDFLFGGRGNDTIDGGGGNDMVTSVDFTIAGNWVDEDQKIDLGKGTHSGKRIGTDKLTSIESFYSGDGNDTIVGTNGGNTIIGGGGDDIINGKSGRDEIWSGAGSDAVTGGGGADLFAFVDFGAGSDRIMDFKHGKDHIGLVRDSLPIGALAARHFRAGLNARDEDDFVIYSRTKGRLFVDFDGDGDRPKVLIATLVTKPVLTASDFTIVDQSADWWLV
jgi:Ca2+-binding RTX toxin-like protein